MGILTKGDNLLTVFDTGWAENPETHGNVLGHPSLGLTELTGRERVPPALGRKRSGSPRYGLPRS